MGFYLWCKESAFFAFNLKFKLLLYFNITNICFIKAKKARNHWPHVLDACENIYQDPFIMSVGRPIIISEDGQCYSGANGPTPNRFEV